MNHEGSGCLFNEKHGGNGNEFDLTISHYNLISNSLLRKATSVINLTLASLPHQMMTWQMHAPLSSKVTVFWEE